MFSDLDSNGFHRATLWTHPFINLDSDTAGNANNSKFMVQDVDGSPAIVKWWDGIGMSVDPTNADAVKW
jgi:alpha-glucosidase (family GH31 glycosyl hydrolase)